MLTRPGETEWTCAEIKKAELRSKSLKIQVQKKELHQQLRRNENEQRASLKMLVFAQKKHEDRVATKEKNPDNAKSAEMDHLNGVTS